MQCKVCGSDNPAQATFCASRGNPLSAAVEPTGTIGVGQSYSHAWGLLRKYFFPLLLMVVLLAIAQSVSSVFGFAGRPLGAAGMSNILSLAYSLLVIGPLGYGVSFACLKVTRGDSIEVADMFAAFRNWGNSILASLLTSIVVTVGFILLVVPGIILACKLAFVPYLVIDRQMDAVSAMKESWRMTAGYAWRIFLVGLLAIPMILLGLICLVVGVFVAAMWIGLAFASFYFAVSRTTARGEMEVASASRTMDQRPMGPTS